MIAAARVTGASLRADLENSRAQNRRLQQQLRNLENRLSHVEGAGWSQTTCCPDVLAQLADQQLARNESPNSTRTLRDHRTTPTNHRRARRRPHHQPRAHAASQPPKRTCPQPRRPQRTASTMTSEANLAGICLTQPNAASATDDSRITSPRSPSDTPASEVPPAPTEPKSLQHQPSSGSRPTLPRKNC